MLFSNRKLLTCILAFDEHQIKIYSCSYTWLQAYEIADKQERLEMKMEKVLADTERMSLLLDQYRATVIQYG